MMDHLPASILRKSLRSGKVLEIIGRGQPIADKAARDKLMGQAAVSFAELQRGTATHMIAASLSASVSAVRKTGLDFSVAFKRATGVHVSAAFELARRRVSREYKNAPGLAKIYQGRIDRLERQLLEPTGF